MDSISLEFLADSLLEKMIVLFLLVEKIENNNSIVFDNNSRSEIECPSLCFYQYSEDTSTEYYIAITFKQCLSDFANPDLSGIIQDFLYQKADFYRYSKDFYESISYKNNIYCFTIDIP